MKNWEPKWKIGDFGTKGETFRREPLIERLFGAKNLGAP